MRINLPLWSLHAQDFEGSLFELHAQGVSSAMIKAVANELTVFELSSNGTATMQGMRMVSGGVDVLSGGIKVVCACVNV